MRKIFILICILTVSACTVNKIHIGDYYTTWYREKDSVGYVHYHISSESVVFNYRVRSVGVMDTYRDTFPQFRVELPIFRRWGRVNKDFFFFYGRKKAIFIHRDSHDKSTSPFVVYERCDSLDNFNLWDYFLRKKIDRIIPENDKYTYKCLIRNNTRIFIYNFKSEEMDKAVEMIKNSFEYLPYE